MVLVCSGVGGFRLYYVGCGLWLLGYMARCYLV